MDNACARQLLLGLPVVAKSRSVSGFLKFFYFHVVILQFPDRLCGTEAYKIFMRHILISAFAGLVLTSKCSLSPEYT